MSVQQHCTEQTIKVYLKNATSSYLTFPYSLLRQVQEVRSNPRASARERFEKNLSLGGQRQVSQKKSGIRTQESGAPNGRGA